MKSIISSIKIAALGFFVLSSCELLDVKPDHVVPEEIAFNDVESYQMALNYVYRNLTSSVNNMQCTDFASDDFQGVIPGYAPTNYYLHYWDYQSQPQPYVWGYQYKLIANENVLINNYDLVPVGSEYDAQMKDYIYAQALALRSWSLFNVAQLYAPRYDGSNGNEVGIPLKLNLALEYLAPAPIGKVYQQIFDDLDKAERLMLATGHRPSLYDKPYQFNIDAIRALRARVALFTGNYDLAGQAAAHFIDVPLLDKEQYPMLWQDEFGSENQEIIFMTHDLSDTDDADLIDYHEIYESNNAILHNDLLAAFSADDVRKQSAFIDAKNMPAKYIIAAADNKGQADRNLHYKHFRVAEQYLIYAEAVLDSNPQEAMRVLNILREKRGAELLSAVPDKAEVLEERRKELFAEGLRFYDLKRLSHELNIVVQRANGAVLVPNSPLYNWAVPREETNSNPNYN
ncbi:MULTISPECIES: RagB/SusD family nutrient uptake outer membrane protein [unclassified Carboxylicivirga]|uniref:RagB/SusD family nutrient uptake outer membrane protein n=1 Tax=Carboxylicivirga TaxID=1628153 RepID=UPI003D3364B2